MKSKSISQNYTTFNLGVPVRKTGEQEIILTPREKDVLKLVVEAYSSSEIADMLGVSYHTITSHRKNINAKLGTSTIAEVIKLAKEKALI